MKLLIVNDEVLTADTMCTDIAWSDYGIQEVLDPSKALPEFIEALKVAGIDAIIEENQRQLDEWAESNK